jgi:hypothetical protein
LVLLLTHNLTIYNNYEKFEERIIRSRQSKKNRTQCPKEKGQTMIYKTLHRKLTIEQSEPTKNGVN